MGEQSSTIHQQQRSTGVSKNKPLRTTLLAVLFQVTWPHRLSKQNIFDHIDLYAKNATKALYRDIETLTGEQVEDLPEPDADDLTDWCARQQQRKHLALTYEKRTGTFGLAQSLFSLNVDEDEARAFVTLQEGFSPGTPYAKPVQHLLQRWEWLFTEKSRQLVQRKRNRRARPILLPLSPVVDYSQHSETILLLDQALEEGAYVSFAYTPLSQNWDDPPIAHQHTEPYELEYRDGHWYFTAYIFEMNTFLDYRVDRIRPDSLRKDRERFSPGGRPRPGVKVSYWMSPMLARHGSLSARLQKQQVTMHNNDGGATVEGYAKSLWWARRLLLGYGDQVKALAPEELVTMMRETTLAMNRLYEEEK